MNDRQRLVAFLVRQLFFILWSALALTGLWLLLAAAGLDTDLCVVAFAAAFAAAGLTTIWRTTR